MKMTSRSCNVGFQAVPTWQGEGGLLLAILDGWDGPVVADVANNLGFHVILNLTWSLMSSQL